MEIIGYNNITVDSVWLITYQKLKDPQNSQDILKSILYLQKNQCNVFVLKGKAWTKHELALVFCF